MSYDKRHFIYIKITKTIAPVTCFIRVSKLYCSIELIENERDLGIWYCKLSFNKKNQHEHQLVTLLKLTDLLFSEYSFLKSNILCQNKQYSL